MFCLFKGEGIFVKGQKFLSNRRIDQDACGVTIALLLVIWVAIVSCFSICFHYLHLLVFSRGTESGGRSHKKNKGLGYIHMVASSFRVSVKTWVLIGMSSATTTFNFKNFQELTGANTRNNYFLSENRFFFFCFY